MSVVVALSAVDGGFMAADKQVTIDGLSAIGTKSKITRVSNALIGVVGEVSACAQFRSGFEKSFRGIDLSDNTESIIRCKQDALLPDGVDDFAALVLTANGIVYCDATCIVELDNPFWAIGSGGQIALGSMASCEGDDPIERVRKAVARTCIFSPDCSGTVEVSGL